MASVAPVARLALTLAIAAILAALVPVPGPYLAIGLGIAGVGIGCMGYGRRTLRGSERLGCALAVTVGGVGLLLGITRVVLALAALAHLESMLG